MTTGPSSQQICSAVQQALPQARALWLFGSAARGAMREGSDIDLAVTLATALTPQDESTGMTGKTTP